MSAERIAGLDEAGRGCLAGPVTAAAVILPADAVLPGLADSKTLSPARRERLALAIREQALAWALGWASREEIDRLNILQASLLAMRRALAGLAVPPSLCRVDGNQDPGLGLPTVCVVGGDGRHAEIMAASILAKTARDAHLLQLDARYPGYGLAAHKGYGSPAHLAALKRLGPSPEHRLSFAPCAAAARLTSGGRVSETAA
ncbi:MAG TPA: ribonuclease HII [Nevskiaceae bacterium]|nr:ribonuclease HII [Nevskiaceae bacterium]